MDNNLTILTHLNKWLNKKLYNGLEPTEIDRKLIILTFSFKKLNKN